MRQTKPEGAMTPRAPARFTPAMDRGETAPYPCWPSRYGFVLHRMLPRRGPPWRVDPADPWAVSDGVTGRALAGLAGYLTPVAALRALHRQLREARRRTGKPYARIVADARRRIVWGDPDRCAGAG